MTTLPPLRRSRPETVQPARPSTITRARLPTDPLQRIIKLVSAVEDAYAPAAAMQPQRSSSSALPPLRSKASTPQPVPTAAPAPPRSQSPRSTLKTKRMMLQHLESCFDSAEGTERTAIMLAEAQSRSRLLAQCDLPREAKQTPELQRAPSPIRTRPGRVPPRHVAKTKTATAYPLRRASVMEQIDRHSVEATEGKEWDWLIAVERQARVQALERSKLQRRIDTKQNRERERQRVASSVVLDVLDDAAALDDLRWEVAQSVVHKGIVAAIAAHAAEAAHKAEVSSVEKRRHQFAEALVERLVGSIAGRDAPAART